jgi:copper(I)-binding protein
MKVSVSSIVASLALVIALSSSGAAHQVVVGKLKIGHPWVHEAVAGAPGTYSCIIEIHNDGDEPERLLGATIEGAGTGVLYKIIENNGHFTSQPVPEGLVIPAHGSVELSPTTYQLKFGKITKTLEADTEVDGTLVFEKLHSAPVVFMVEQDDTAPKEDAPLAEGEHSKHEHDHTHQ